MLIRLLYDMYVRLLNVSYNVGLYELVRSVGEKNLLCSAARLP